MKNPGLDRQQVKFLKARAHALKPVVRIGQHGLSDAVLRELDIALDHHELLKVKISAADRDTRTALLDELMVKSGAELVQAIGGVAVLFRRNPDTPIINLAEARP